MELECGGRGVGGAAMQSRSSCWTLSGRFHPQIRGKNRRGIGKSESVCTDSKMMETPGSLRPDGSLVELVAGGVLVEHVVKAEARELSSAPVHPDRTPPQTAQHVKVAGLLLPPQQWALPHRHHDAGGGGGGRCLLNLHLGPRLGGPIY
jgi:hypothetical protein